MVEVNGIDSAAGILYEDHYARLLLEPGYNRQTPVPSANRTLRFNGVRDQVEDDLLELHA